MVNSPLSPDQIEEYRRDGITLLPSLLDATTLGQLHEAIDSIVAGAIENDDTSILELEPEEVDGKKLETYFDWCSITYAISLTSCPAMSLPMGFTENGLPVGVQIIAPPLAEADLFRAAAALEGILDIAGRLPVDPVSS